MKEKLSGLDARELYALQFFVNQTLESDVVAEMLFDTSPADPVRVQKILADISAEMDRRGLPDNTDDLAEDDVNRIAEGGEL